MSSKIRMIFESCEIDALLNESETAQLIEASLPIEASVNTWGEEVYFSIPVNSAEKPEAVDVEVGELGYWPPGSAFCIFFGKTPASLGDKPRAASPVVRLGNISGGVEELFKVQSGERVRIEKLPEK